MPACYRDEYEHNLWNFMVTDKIKALAITKARVAELEKSIATELNRELAALPAKFGFDNLSGFFDAVKAAFRGKIGHAKPKGSAGGKKRRKRAVITAETKAKVKSLVEGGKTGAE